MVQKALGCRQRAAPRDQPSFKPRETRSPNVGCECAENNAIPRPASTSDNSRCIGSPKPFGCGTKRSSLLRTERFVLQAVNSLCISPQMTRLPLQVLEELKAQGFLAAGSIFQAIRSATHATELEPGWADGWVTLGRAQARARNV